jgi:hypothetical protein
MARININIKNPRDLFDSLANLSRSRCWNKAYQNLDACGKIPKSVKKFLIQK